MNFKNLHQQNHPLVIGNVWDVASAKTAEKLNFQAIGTSSAAIASMLGYGDGEQLSFSELAYIVKRIAVSTQLPLTVDLEAGYSREPETIADHISQLADLGVVGINLEDSLMNGERRLLEAEEVAGLLKALKSHLNEKGMGMFINMRTDTFLLGLPNALDETIRRVNLYQAAGADGLFVPCITQENDIQKVVEMTDLPVNVMCMPELPSFEKLSDLGVKRISMGNFLFDRLQSVHDQTLTRILEQKSFEPVFQE